jgi:hypothetical protein
MYWKSAPEYNAEKQVEEKHKSKKTPFHVSKPNLG